MKTKSIFFTTLIITIFSLIFMILIREVPIVSPWKSWKVLSVSNTIPETHVIKELNKISITQIISKSSQKLNTSNPLSPILPSEFNFYINNLHRFFSDKDNNYNLYYLPKNTPNKSLKNLPFEYNIDLKSSFPYFTFVLSIVSILLLILFSKNKLIIASINLPFLLLNIVFPSFNSFILTLFSLIIIYFLDKYEGRNNKVNAIKHNIFIIISFIACLVISVLSGIKGFILYLLTVIACFGIKFLLNYFENYINSKKYRFNFVNIVSAKNIKFDNIKSQIIFCTLSIFILLGGLSFFLFPSAKNNSSNNTPLSIPTPLEYNGTRSFSLSSYTNLQTKKSPTEIPDLGDYVSQVWYSTIFPFIPLKNNKGYSSKITPETSVNTIDYFEENGKIKTKTVEVAKFSKQFVDTALEKINNCQYPIIEKVLLDQNSFCAVDYGYVKRNSSFTMILFIISLIFSFAEVFIFFRFYKLGC